MRKMLIGLMALGLVGMSFAGSTERWGGYLKVSTPITIPVGPFEDDAGDGVLVTVTPANVAATFIYSTGALVENLNLGAATNLLTVLNGTDPDAWSTILITAANTANTGVLLMTLWDLDTIEPITYRFIVLSAKAYNLQYGGTVDVATGTPCSPPARLRQRQRLRRR
jgi:hypothetical protein